MNDELLLILSSIKNALGEQMDESTSANNLCDVIYERDTYGCDSLNCIDCVIGYKDSTQYTHQVIQTWKIL